jgi:hypothetical protein
MTAAKFLDNACPMAQSTRRKNSVSMSYGAAVLACADQPDRNADRIEPRLLDHAKIVGLERDTPGSLPWSVQGVPEIDASAEQAIIIKGVVVLRECQRTGCRNQCDAETNAGHPTDNGKSHGTRVEIYLEKRQPPALVLLEDHSEGSINPAQVSPEPYDPLQTNTTETTVGRLR